MLNNILQIIQLVLAVLLIIVILLQQKGSGMGAAFGGSGTVFTTRRGIDKVLYNLTIVISVAFFLLAIVNLVIA
ncbi:MAG: preprotein translocase subunit SecG [Candidatus Magasanikbacteria bacterium RIFOXYC12_FULL_33_11]|uniref:Protein-export membrane protein SecG n=2 Tax=Candidatus Magasanikiibacteriota TaxID=1752731 RepID=A0A1F6NM35_9BACT|nr:MAG: preprotein translocase subunit SecG [Candidatus Magasanikbacteria bacterium RIFOXYC12_FULL_33_11]PIZ95969.1 MAG: preprotein translocase subunit SecG [Candidatus Magasanikbacteria bacterium CG_4_10_14_0_2_um_filter_33_14]